MQTDPQVAVPVSAKLAGNRILHAERILVELASRAVDACDLVECVFDEPDVAIATDSHSVGGGILVVLHPDRHVVDGELLGRRVEPDDLALADRGTPARIVRMPPPRIAAAA